MRWLCEVLPGWKMGCCLQQSSNRHCYTIVSATFVVPYYCSPYVGRQSQAKPGQLRRQLQQKMTRAAALPTKFRVGTSWSGEWKTDPGLGGPAISRATRLSKSVWPWQWSCALSSGTSVGKTCPVACFFFFISSHISHCYTCPVGVSAMNKTG